MKYPVSNFKSDWSTTAGYGFGDKTDYGYHEADDLNLNGGGNIDLGQPLFAVADGVISSVHTHTGSPTFGKHLHLNFKIDGKDYWAHYAHCNEIFVTEGQSVKEGDKIATVGNSGTTFAHCHFAIKNQPTGIDGIAKTLEDLKKWESPIAFVERYLVGQNDTQKIIDELREARDNNWQLHLADQEKINELTKQIEELQQKNQDLRTINDTLTKTDANLGVELLDAQHKASELETTLQSVAEALKSGTDIKSLLTAIDSLKTPIDEQVAPLVKHMLTLQDVLEDFIYKRVPQSRPLITKILDKILWWFR